MTISLQAQIEEVQREIELRKRVYPRMVARHEMRESVAEYHLERMMAVLKTLQDVKELSDAKLNAPRLTNCENCDDG